MNREPVEVPSAAADFLNWIEHQKRWNWKDMRSKARAVSGKEQVSSLTSFVKTEEEILLSSPWHLLTVTEKRPGIFELWFLQNQITKKIELSLDRRIYIHLNHELGINEGMKLSYHRLAYAERNFLYELRVSEENFQNIFPRIRADFNDPAVEGIYEADLPMELLSLLNTSPMMRVKHSIKRKPKSLEDDLEGVFTEAYLAGYCNFLLLVVLQSDTRKLYALFNKDNLILQVFIVDPAMKRQVGTNLKTLYVPQKSTEYFDYNRVPEFDVSFYPEESLALRSLGVSIASYVNYTLLVSGNVPFDTDLLPCINLELLAAELPALDWQRFGIRRSLEAFYCCSDSLSERIQQSRFSQIPLGCLHGNSDGYYSQIIDLFWARTQRRSGYLLSSSKRADLLSPINLPDPFFIQPGGTKFGVVEVVMQSFVLNSVMAYAEINDSSVKENPILSMCKGMLSGWIDSYSRGNVQAGILISQLARWLSLGRLVSSQLKLVIDASVNRALYKLVLFLQKLGLTVYYADSQRLLLGLSPSSASSSISYEAQINFLLKQVSEKAEFEYVVFVLARQWKTLLFMDWNNYGGIQVTGKKGAQDIELDCDWNLCEYLPALLQKPFKLIINEFIKRISGQGGVDSRGEDGDKENTKKAANNLLRDDDEAELEGISVPTSVKELLIKVVISASKLMTGPALSKQELKQREFPHILGARSDHKPTSPVVEFIKSSIAVLSLYPQTSANVQKLADKAFTLIGVSGFSDAAQFKNPAHSIVLRGLFCQKCGRERNLDIAREPDLSSLQCYYCCTLLDKTSLEAIIFFSPRGTPCSGCSL